MKKSNFKSVMLCAAAAAFLLSAMPGDQVISKEGKSVVVNTTSITKSVKGYMSTTPLKIYITNNIIEKIEALPNQETPKYFTKVKKQMLDKWNGMTVNKAIKAKVDGVTGATLSSDAVRKNVVQGLEYYKKNK